MVPIKWFNTHFRELRKVARARIQELRTEFCVELENNITDDLYDPDFDVYLKAKGRSYLKEVKRWKTIVNDMALETPEDVPEDLPSDTAKTDKTE